MPWTLTHLLCYCVTSESAAILSAATATEGQRQPSRPAAQPANKKVLLARTEKGRGTQDSGEKRWTATQKILAKQYWKQQMVGG